MAEKQAAHRQQLESRALKGDLLKSMMGTVLAYITFGGSMFGAVYFSCTTSRYKVSWRSSSPWVPPSAQRSTPTSFNQKESVKIINHRQLFRRWWAPKSCGLTILSCEMDVRTGGTYRLVFGHPASEQPMAFFGRYIEVTPHARIVWTNDEGGEGGAITTLTFEERGDETLVVMHDLYPSKEALDAAIASGSTSRTGEQFEQLDELLVTLHTGVERS